MPSFDRHFQTIFHYSPVGQAILDTSGRLVQTNRAVEALLGSAEPRGLQSYIDPRDVQDFEASLSQLRGLERPSCRLECRLAGRGETWMRIDLSYVGEQGVSPFVFASIEDITGRKMDEERLRRDKDAAEKATQTKSAFLANMSHEIRTPIHTITGMTELLFGTRLDEEQKEYASQIQYSTDVLQGLINDILDFSKIEAGKLTLEMIELSFTELLEDAVEMLSMLAHKKGLEVILDISDDVPERLEGDPVRLRQVIINLLNNAVKFTAEGEILIRARVFSPDDGGNSVIVEVSDTGIGVPEDKHDLLFNSFTQLDSSTTRRFGGTGLGLSICKSLTSMWGGSIGVHGREGGGSTFWFSVPFGRRLPARRQPPCMRELKSRRILIVDDNDTARKLLFHKLSDVFSHIESAVNGPEALKKLRAALFDLALIDIFMPGMDGWQLASEVNSDKSINATKLVLMCPSGAGTEAKMKLLGWFNAYLTKPLRIGALFECLVAVLDSEMELQAGEGACAEEGPTAAGRSILVAEDHIVNQQLFRTILEKLGYHVVLAADGREAVQAMQRERVDLVFMDIQMPVMNGLEACAAIRAFEPLVPIVAVTANVLKGERERCLEVGMNDYLAKPFKARDLERILGLWLPAGAPGEEGAAIEEGAPGDEGAAGEVLEELEAVDGEDPEESPLCGEGQDGAEALVFDEDKAVDAFMGRRDVVARVVKAFLTKLESQLKSMHTAFDSGDWEGLRIESHGIKGGSWNLEARRLGDAAALLEAAARERNRAEAARCLELVRIAGAEFRARVTETGGLLA